MTKQPGNPNEVTIDLKTLSDTDLVTLLSEYAVNSVKAYHEQRFLDYQRALEVARLAWMELESRRTLH